MKYSIKASYYCKKITIPSLLFHLLHRAVWSLLAANFLPVVSGILFSVHGPCVSQALPLHAIISEFINPFSAHFTLFPLFSKRIQHHCRQSRQPTHASLTKTTTVRTLTTRPFQFASKATSNGHGHPTTCSQTAV
ncbi:hypothetical protein BZA77DRAFT_23203 [Pyronema omphalodes]|nr:hypothetical protein BZA77DRAFT_23203 [Pyronema omphalodes]